ncbi:MAG: transketolase C-terminal domain-containing protein [Patescibacteria group bacterium]|nr:transketolase C-terminal domain-containing protein [Patescibacteria group bacterium]
MKQTNLAATRDGFGQGLIEAAERNSRVVVLCADLTNSMRMDKFAGKYAERFIQCGVAEQNMIGVAAGLALGRKIPFAASFAAFSPGRTYDQIRTTIAYSDLNVIVVGGHAGLATGEDGATNQMLEDVSMMRALPNMLVVQPCDAHQARLATLALVEHSGPAYLRLSRPKVENISQKSKFKLGQAQILKEGSDVTIFASGIVVQEALSAALSLEKDDVSVRVINLHTIKPLDEESILEAALETKLLISVEDHQVNGGLGGAISEVLHKLHLHKKIKSIPLFKIVGVEDQFGKSGNWKKLYEKYGLSAKQLSKTVKNIYKKRKYYAAIIAPDVGAGVDFKKSFQPNEDSAENRTTLIITKIPQRVVSDAKTGKGKLTEKPEAVSKDLAQALFKAQKNNYHLTIACNTLSLPEFVDRAKKILQKQHDLIENENYKLTTTLDVLREEAKNSDSLPLFLGTRPISLSLAQDKGFYTGFNLMDKDKSTGEHLMNKVQDMIWLIKATQKSDFKNAPDHVHNAYKQGPENFRDYVEKRTVQLGQMLVDIGQKNIILGCTELPEWYSLLQKIAPEIASKINALNPADLVAKRFEAILY